MDVLMVFGGGLGAGLLLIAAMNYFVPSNATEAWMHHPSASGAGKKDDDAADVGDEDGAGESQALADSAEGEQGRQKRLRRRATSNASAKAKAPQPNEGAEATRRFVDDSGNFDADALLALTEEEEKLLRAAARSINPTATDEEIEKEVADARARARAQVEKDGPMAFTKGSQFRENARAVGTALDVIVVLVVLGVMAYLIKRDYKMEWMDFIAKFLPREVAVLRGEHVGAED